MRGASSRLKEQGLTDADIARIHAPIGLDIGAVSPAEIAVAIMGEITARCGARQRMKFGPVPPADALGATAVHTIRQGALVLKKGTVIGPQEVAALKAAGVPEIVVARLEPGDVSGGRCRRRDRGGGGGRGRARRPRLHRPRQSVRRASRRARRRQGRDRPAQPRRRGDHVRDAARLQAGGRRRDDRDREDHSVRGRRARAATPRSTVAAQAKPLRARRALRAAQGRRRLDAAAGPRRQGRREDAEGHGRAAGAGRREHHRRAPRAA